MLHGIRRTPMTKYEAALKIQKAWRIKAARLFMLKILAFSTRNATTDQLIVSFITTNGMKHRNGTGLCYLETTMTYH